MLIDTNRIDPSKPIDLVTIMNTGLFKMSPDERHYGVNLTDEGADIFNVKVNIEVQWTSELVIATIEKLGGVITTAYYDQHSLQAMMDAKKFFERGKNILYLIKYVHYDYVVICNIRTQGLFITITPRIFSCSLSIFYYFLF